MDLTLPFRCDCYAQLPDLQYPTVLWPRADNTLVECFRTLHGSWYKLNVATKHMGHHALQAIYCITQTVM
eukprot:1309526-Amphidinium_carterae.3